MGEIGRSEGSDRRREGGEAGGNAARGEGTVLRRRNFHLFETANFVSVSRNASSKPIPRARRDSVRSDGEEEDSWRRRGILIPGLQSIAANQNPTWFVSGLALPPFELPRIALNYFSAM